MISDDLPAYGVITNCDQQHVAEFQNRCKNSGIWAKMYYGLHHSEFNGLGNKENQPVSLATTNNHMTLWRFLRGIGYAYSLVVDETCKFHPNFQQKYEKLVRDLPEDWDFVFLGHEGTENQKPVKIGKYFGVYEQPWGVFCYLVRSTIITPLITRVKLNHGPIDLQIEKKFKDFNIYCATPKMADYQGVV